MLHKNHNTQRPALTSMQDKHTAGKIGNLGTILGEFRTHAIQVFCLIHCLASTECQHALACVMDYEL